VADLPPSVDRPAPAGWDRVHVATGWIAAALLAGLVGCWLVAAVVVVATESIVGLVLGFWAGLLVASAATVWLCLHGRMGPVFAWSAGGLVALVLFAYIVEWQYDASLALVSAVLLVVLARLTDPARLRRAPRPLTVLGTTGLLVLAAAVPPLVRDVATWREMTAALERYGEPPLMPVAPDLGVTELNDWADGVGYLVTDEEGVAFASVRLKAVEQPPGAPGDDCFSTLIGDPPMTGCTEIAAGVYRAEYRADRGSYRFFLPRTTSVVAVGEHVTGANLGKYGADGPGEEMLRQVATSLRPVPVQDLARRSCRPCRLLPG
jgi:hypothetical protein